MCESTLASGILSFVSLLDADFAVGDPAQKLALIASSGDLRRSVDLFVPTYSAVDGVAFVAGGGFEIQHRAVKEAGYPQIKTLQDYENVIKAYIEKHPSDENGNPNIGLSLNADDWRMYISVTNPAAEVPGKSGDGEYYIDPETYEATYHFRTEGEKEYFQWLNHMNAIGLLDKDSFVQKYDHIWRRSLRAASSV